METTTQFSIRPGGYAYYFVMFSVDSNNGGPAAAAGRVALLVTLALLFWLGGDRLAGIESGYYDLLQRATAGPGSSRVVILATGGAGADPWTLPEFPDLVQTLGRAGALVVLPATPPPLATRPKDVSRLAGLVDLERRTGGAEDGARLKAFSRQLEEARSRLLLQERTASEIARAGNVALGLAIAAQPRPREMADEGCQARISATAGAFAPLLGPGTPAGTPLAASAELCQAVASLGYLEYPADRDGLVRHAYLAVNTPGGALPDVSLAASGVGGDALARFARAGNDAAILTRFYAGAADRPAFRTMTAAELATGSATVKGRFVIIGPAQAAPDAGVPTPVDPAMTLAVLAATRLGNLLDGDFLTRPSWAPWAELMLALALAGTAAVWGYRLALLHAAVAAVTTAGILLAAEALLFLTAGVWVQLASLAVFCLAGMAVGQALRYIPGRPAALLKRAGSIGSPSPGARSGAELDLAFSVLRQQTTNDQTKLKLYELAMEHGRNRDYARAERVFRHLAARDSGYRDVASKLEKLSGARATVLPRGAEPGTPPKTAGNDAQAATRTLGRYELERVIGRGAMATVYLGRDPTINRRVAIKTVPLAEEFADSDLATARSSFMREAESSGRLNHPHIISIYDAGEDQRVAYLAMEYFEGRPLSHYAQLGRLLPPSKVLELMARAADALDYAHSQNVVHRDVKPANILYQPATDTLKLTDFGIARLTDASRTRTGIILGTPSYMSPEQLSASRVSGQSDLYSLGVTMYHLLTGSPPFQADSIPKLMEKIVHQRHRPVRDIRDDVPPCADGILDKAMAKDPADRFESGRAMALALRECCSRFSPETP